MEVWGQQWRLRPPHALAGQQTGVAGGAAAQPTNWQPSCKRGSGGDNGGSPHTSGSSETGAQPYVPRRALHPTCLHTHPPTHRPTHLGRLGVLGRPPLGCPRAQEHLAKAALAQALACEGGEPQGSAVRGKEQWQLLWGALLPMQR